MAASLAHFTTAVTHPGYTAATTATVRRQQRAVAVHFTRRGASAATFRRDRGSGRGDAVPQAAGDDDADAASTATKSNGSGKGKGKGKPAAGGGGGGRADSNKKIDGPSKNEEARKALTLAFATGEAVSGRVEVANRGGLILRIFNGRFRAFLPLSQMAASRTAGIKGRQSNAPVSRTAPAASFDEEELMIPPAKESVPAESKAGKDATVAALESQVGNVIDVKITSVEDKKIVVSERALAQDRGAKALKVGVQVTGRVVSMSDFGAFIELSEDDPQAPRLEGLIHISELSWNRISHPRDVVRVVGGAARPKHRTPCDDNTYTRVDLRRPTRETYKLQ